jgi:hypothetical protein
MFSFFVVEFSARNRQQLRGTRFRETAQPLEIDPKQILRSFYDAFCGDNLCLGLSRKAG